MDCTVTVAAGEDVAAALKPDAVVCLSAGVHRVNLDLTHGVTLRGDAGAVLDGGRKSPVVRVGVHGQQVTLENLEIRGGSHEFGSGVLVEGYSDITIRQCTIAGNERGPSGGHGIGVHRGQVTVTGGRVSDDVVVTTAAKAAFDGVKLGALTVREGAEVTVRGGAVARLALAGTSTRQPTVTLQGAEVGETDNAGAYPGTVVVEPAP
jgi:Nitrous oxidase accessory protein